MHKLFSRFHPQNVLGIRNFADTLSHAHLISSADKYRTRGLFVPMLTHFFSCRYINYKFSSIATSEEFLQLSFADLIEIIRRDEINCTSEEIVRINQTSSSKSR